MESLKRIPTGIIGLDEIMHGGMVPESSYLVIGGPGTGKTIMSVQFLLNRVAEGEKCVYISLAEPLKSIRRNTSTFGWDLSGIKFVDMTDLSGEVIANGEYHAFPPSEVEYEPVWKRIYESIEEHKPERLVIDSVTNLRYLSTDEYQFRKQMQKLVNYLSEAGCLSLLLFEPCLLTQEFSVAIAVDGIISLRNSISQGRVIELRSLEVMKLRGSGYLSGYHPLHITDNGLVIYPHRIEKHNSNSVNRILIPSGLDELDQLLKGGVLSGSSTLVTGPSGTGKSSLCTQFLVMAAESGIKSVIYTFEEGSLSMLERCNSINIPLQKHVDSGKIEIKEINPLELYPDQFLEIIRHDIEEEKKEIAVLDSIRGYNLAMEQFGNIVSHIQNLVNFFRRRGATLFLVNELERLTGDLRLTDNGISYLSDNVILLRYSEYHGRVIKLISCLKRRFSDFEPELREFTISQRGLRVGEKLEHLRGILTGVPVSDRDKSNQ